MTIVADSTNLRRVPLFAQCDQTSLQVLSFSADRRAFAEGEVLFAQDAEAKAAFLILSGNIEVGRAHSQGATPKIYGLAEPGALLGETEMIAGSTYAMTARAKRPASAMRIGRELFMRVVQEYPDFSSQLLRNLTFDLDESMKLLGATYKLLKKPHGFSDS